MAIDTKADRFSIMNFGMFVSCETILIDPDGTIDQGDRQHLLGLYRDILFASPDPDTGNPQSLLLLDVGI